MTTYVPFLPAPGASPPFQTSITLDGNSYSLSASWNFYRGGWYMMITDSFGNLVMNQPLIGSPTEADINIIWAYFQTSTLVYRALTGNFEVNP